MKKGKHCRKENSCAENHPDKSSPIRQFESGGLQTSACQSQGFRIPGNISLLMILLTRKSVIKAL